jgi:hypothetical protein
VDTRRHTQTGWTLADTLAAREAARGVMAANDVLVQDDDGQWIVNEYRHVGMYDDARKLYDHAARVAREITATPRGTYPPDARKQAATRRTAVIAAERLAARTLAARVRGHVAHVESAATERPRVATYRTHWNPAGRTWATAGRTCADTRGYVRLARHGVRAMLDTLARERVAALEAVILADSRYLAARDGGRVEAARVRAGLMPTAIAFADTRYGVWDEYTPREIVNARETRAAERGRGIIKRGPSAARVTTRDVYAPATTLRMLRTVGVATHAHATGHDYTRLLQMILARPTLATYRVRAHADDAGRVLPVHVTVAHTPRHAATLDTTPMNAAERQAAIDAAAHAAIGPDIAATSQ